MLDEPADTGREDGLERVHDSADGRQTSGREVPREAEPFTVEGVVHHATDRFEDAGSLLALRLAFRRDQPDVACVRVAHRPVSRRIRAASPSVMPISTVRARSTSARWA